MNLQYKDGEYEKPLCTNGYLPIAIITMEEYNKPYVERFMTEVTKHNMDFVSARCLFYEKQEEYNNYLKNKETMPLGKIYTPDEVNYITKMLDTKQRTVKEVAEYLGRTEYQIKKKYARIKAESRKNTGIVVKRGRKPKSVEEYIKAQKELNVVSVSAPEKKEEIVSTSTMTPREMIKRLYDLGYRIEDNKIVCYVKQTVNVQDIINNR